MTDHNAPTPLDELRRLGAELFHESERCAASDEMQQAGFMDAAQTALFQIADIIEREYVKRPTREQIDDAIFALANAIDNKMGRPAEHITEHGGRTAIDAVRLVLSEERMKENLRTVIFGASGAPEALDRKDEVGGEQAETTGEAVGDNPAHIDPVVQVSVNNAAPAAPIDNRTLQLAATKLMVHSLLYDRAIRGKAAKGDFETLDPGGALAQGIDLDALYENWIFAAFDLQDALAANAAAPPADHRTLFELWDDLERWVNTSRGHRSVWRVGHMEETLARWRPAIEAARESARLSDELQAKHNQLLPGMEKLRELLAKATFKQELEALTVVSEWHKKQRQTMHDFTLSRRRAEELCRIVMRDAGYGNKGEQA